MLTKVKEGLLKLKTSNKHEPEVISLDVTDSFDVVKKKLDFLIIKFSCIDILINIAGVSFRGEVSLFSSFKINKSNFYQIFQVFFHI